MVVMTSRCTRGRGRSGGWGGRLFVSVPIRTSVTVVVVKASVTIAVLSVSVAILMVDGVMVRVCLTSDGGHGWTRRAVSGRRLHVEG